MTPVTPITILLALIAMAAAFWLRPGRVLGLIIASMFFWPEYLRIPLGLAQMSIPRLTALALITRMLIRGNPLGIRWSWIDGLVIFGWIWDLTANLVEGAGITQMTFMIGRVFDTTCMYFAARLSLRSFQSYGELYVPAALIAVVMGVLGALEAMSSHSPFEHLYAYGGGAWFNKDAEYRHGLLRAKASMGHAIYFGMAMTALTGILYSLRNFARSRSIWVLTVGAGLLGAASSLSSGPQLASVILITTNLFFYARQLIKPALIAVFLLCVFAEASSNRHFYQLIDYLALSSSTAWYRGRLLEVAISHWSEYCSFGVGDKWPHRWGAEIDGRLHVDVVNHYIIVLLYGGLPSLVCYVGTIIGAMRSASLVASRGISRGSRRLGFGLACTLIAIAAASMSVGLFGPPLLLVYLLMGAMVALPGSIGCLPTAKTADWRHNRTPSNSPAISPINSTVTRPN